LIDEEVKILIDDSYAKAIKMIVNNKDAFERIAKALLEYETLTKDQLDRIMKNESLENDNEEGSK
jgi:cell division protease FtsH